MATNETAKSAMERVETLVAQGWGDVADYYDTDEAEAKREAWERDEAAWQAAIRASLEAEEMPRRLLALATAARIEAEWGASPATEAVVAALALRVEAGDTPDDYDTGRVVSVDDGSATVAWDSGVRTGYPLCALRAEGAKAVRVTDEEIEELKREAAAAGDEAMVIACIAALSGGVNARKRCAEAIRSARAMEG